MKTRRRLPFGTLALGAMLLLSACASSSPENFFEEGIEQQCKFIKKCEEANWNMLGFDSIKECEDELLQVQIDGQNLKDAFVEACTDFDKSQARKCLRATRSQVRSCELDNSENEEACEDICGAPSTDMNNMSGPAPLFSGPNGTRFVVRALEALDEQGALDEAEDELDAPQGVAAPPL